MPVRPLFLLCLPRGGSTLVQRVLAAHPEVATASEPWLLLPLVYATREAGARADYWHETAAQALVDFAQELPGGPAQLDAGVRELALDLYGKVAGPDPTYFLDKTPRYHHIAEDLLRLFPEAKFVFLWRNPLAVLASHLDTFRDGRFQPPYFMRDLMGGYQNLLAAMRRAGQRAHVVRYEELVAGDESPWRAVFAYLELDFDPGVLTRFDQVELKGRYGDPTGARRYGSLSEEPVAKWKEVLDGRLRRVWSRRYLRRLGEGNLRAMGYEPEALLRDLASLPPNRSDARDLADLSVSLGVQALRDRALRLSEGPRPMGPAFPRSGRLHRR